MVAQAWMFWRRNVRPICDVGERYVWVKGLCGATNEEELEDEDGPEYFSTGRKTRNGVWNMQSAGTEKPESNVKLGGGPDKSQSKDDWPFKERPKPGSLMRLESSISSMNSESGSQSRDVSCCKAKSSSVVGKAS
jgi:hypothetical protein